MKKHRLLILLTVSIFSFIFSAIMRNNIDKQASSEIISVSNYYIVRETDGFIGIYENQSQTPYQILDIVVAELPEKDREMLKEGIVVKSNEELSLLIEDYM